MINFGMFGCGLNAFFNNLGRLFTLNFRSDVELHSCMYYGVFGCEWEFLTCA